MKMLYFSVGDDNEFIEIVLVQSGCIAVAPVEFYPSFRGWKAGVIEFMLDGLGFFLFFHSDSPRGKLGKKGFFIFLNYTKKGKSCQENITKNHTFSIKISKTKKKKYGIMLYACGVFYYKVRVFARPKRA